MTKIDTDHGLRVKYFTAEIENPGHNTPYPFKWRGEWSQRNGRLQKRLGITLMLIKYRPARLEDLDQCLMCVRDGYTYASEERSRLIPLWRRLIQTGAGNLAVIEDATAPTHERIVWFCCAAFVSPEYARAMHHQMPPFLGKQALRLWEAGQAPLLTRNQVAAANSGSGLHLVVLHSGPAPHILKSAELWNQVAAIVIEFGTYHIQGYRLNEFFLEVYTPFSCEWSESGGLDLATDYVGRMTQNDANLAAVGGAPRLYHLTGARARRKSGAVLGALFQYNPPCLFFSAVQQEFLLHALTGETDEEIAGAMGIATVTARKRWSGIYERVVDCAPDALGMQMFAPSREGRGIERKRLLISYLRHHMEELRPTLPAIAPWHAGLDSDEMPGSQRSIDGLFTARAPAIR